ncbi:MAG: hypothetical protein IJE59_04705 [Clostridia bacterium]|nr:hypothetical protein [Clostridia bacterium]
MIKRKSGVKTVLIMVALVLVFVINCALPVFATNETNQETISTTEITNEQNSTDEEWFKTETICCWVGVLIGLIVLLVGNYFNEKTLHEDIGEKASCIGISISIICFVISWFTF